MMTMHVIQMQVHSPNELTTECYAVHLGLAVFLRSVSVKLIFTQHHQVFSSNAVMQTSMLTLHPIRT